MDYALIKSNVVQNVIVADGQGVADAVRDALGCELARDVTGQNVDRNDIYNPGNQTFTKA